MTAKLLRFKPDRDHESGLYGDGGSTPQFVLVNGERVAVVKKRSEWYGNLGRRGVRYWYFDVYALDENGQAITRDTAKLYSATKRGEAVAAALVMLGHVEAAFAADKDYARFIATKLGIEVAS